MMMNNLNKYRLILGEVAMTLALGFILYKTDFNDDSVGQWLYYVFGIYGVLMLAPRTALYFLKDKFK